MRGLAAFSAVVTSFVFSGLAYGQSNEDLAKQLSNPVADLISVPFQLNYDEGYGASGNGSRTTLNIQPVVPISLNDDWNVISRTIVPLIYNDDIIAGHSNFGVGNVIQSLFFSPKQPTSGGWIWGVGPVLQIPLSSSDEFGSDDWAAGPTAVALKQNGPWTFGALANHLWDFAGAETEINATFIQPFLSYTTSEATTISLNTESLYDWEARKWSVPINFVVSKVIPFGGRPVSLSAGVRYWAEAPDAGPDDLGFRLVVTYLFPK